MSNTQPLTPNKRGRKTNALAEEKTITRIHSNAAKKITSKNTVAVANTAILQTLEATSAAAINVDTAATSASSDIARAKPPVLDVKRLREKIVDQWLKQFAQEDAAGGFFSVSDYIARLTMAHTALLCYLHENPRARQSGALVPEQLAALNAEKAEILAYIGSASDIDKAKLDRLHEISCQLKQHENAVRQEQALATDNSNVSTSAAATAALPSDMNSALAVIYSQLLTTAVTNASRYSDIVRLYPVMKNTCKNENVLCGVCGKDIVVGDTIVYSVSLLCWFHLSHVLPDNASRLDRYINGTTRVTADDNSERRNNAMILYYSPNALRGPWELHRHT